MKKFLMKLLVILSVALIIRGSYLFTTIPPKWTSLYEIAKFGLDKGVKVKKQEEKHENERIKVILMSLSYVISGLGFGVAGVIYIYINRKKPEEKNDNLSK